MLIKRDKPFLYKHLLGADLLNNNCISKCFNQLCYAMTGSCQHVINPDFAAEHHHNKQLHSDPLVRLTDTVADSWQ
jgi:hypothetical protein